MLKPLYRRRRDSTWFQLTARRLRNFVGPDHLMVGTDVKFDFGKLVAPREDRYCPDDAPYSAHPKVMVRALPVCSLYDISPFRRLSFAIAENIAYPVV